MNEMHGFAGDALPRLEIEDQVRAQHGTDMQVLYCDPPWKFRANSVNDWGRNAGKHYRLMSPKEIAAIPVKEMMAPQAICFMWITSPMLIIGAHLQVMKAWGFKPKASGFVWIKTNPKAPSMFIDPTIDLHKGLGLTTRKNAEFCLIGTRGKSLRQARNVQEVGIYPRMEHSRKPEQFRDRVESYVGPGLNMVEMFGRRNIDGWTVLGDQVGLFDGR